MSVRSRSSRSTSPPQSRAPNTMGYGWIAPKCNECPVPRLLALSEGSDSRKNGGAAGSNENRQRPTVPEGSLEVYSSRKRHAFICRHEITEDLRAQVLRQE